MERMVCKFLAHGERSVDSCKSKLSQQISAKFIKKKEGGVCQQECAVINVDQCQQLKTLRAKRRNFSLAFLEDMVKTPQDAVQNPSQNPEDKTPFSSENLYLTKFKLNLENYIPTKYTRDKEQPQRGDLINPNNQQKQGSQLRFQQIQKKFVNLRRQDSLLRQKRKCKVINLQALDELRPSAKLVMQPLLLIINDFIIYLTNKIILKHRNENISIPTLSIILDY